MKLEDVEFKVRVVQRTINRVKLAMHPAAEEVYESCKFVKKQFDINKAEASLIEFSQSVSPLCVISKGDAKYEYFAGIELYKALKVKEIEKVCLAIFDLDDEEVIKKFALAPMCNIFAHSVDKSTGLGDLYRALNKHMPPGMSKSLFGVYRITRKYIAGLSNTSIRSIRHQEEQLVKNKIDSSNFIKELKDEK